MMILEKLYPTNNKWLIFCFLFLTIWGNAQTWEEKGMEAMRQEKFEYAAAYFDSALAHCKECTDTTIAKLLIQNAKSHQLNREFDKAYLKYDSAMVILESLEHHNLLFSGYVSLAEFYRKFEHYNEASLALDNAKILSEKHPISKRNLANYYNRKAAISTESNPDRSVVVYYSNKALELAKELDDKSLIATSLNELGFVYEHTNREKKAIELYQQAIDFFKQKNERVNVAGVHINLCRTYNRLSEYEKSIEYAKEGLTLCDSSWFHVKSSLYDLKMHAESELKRYEDQFKSQKNFYNNLYWAREKEWTDKLADINHTLEIQEKERKINEERNDRTLAEIKLQGEKSKNTTYLIITALSIILTTILVVSVRRYKKINEVLKKTSEQKNFLMKEVHHRVKNNLQSLSSLLYLQLSHLKEKKEKELIESTINRVDAIGATHYQLYQNEQFISSDAKSYLDKLIESFERTYQLQHLNCSFHTDIEEIELDFDQCMSIGMITNELVSNTVKHAKSTSGGLKIDLKVWVNGKNIHYNYQDNGETVQKDINKSSLGKVLINAFVRKLEGEFENESKGFNVSFHFPKTQEI